MVCFLMRIPCVCLLSSPCVPLFPLILDAPSIVLITILLIVLITVQFKACDGSNPLNPPPALSLRRG